MTNTSFIIGAYPCAPSFHHKGEQEEQTFWRELSDTPNIRGLEQPCLENLHPLGDEWLFRHTPEDWQIVVTAVMETMRRRGSNGAFGLASADDAQRKACVDFYRHLHQKINAVNARYPGKVIALEMQAARRRAMLRSNRLQKRFPARFGKSRAGTGTAIWCWNTAMP